MRTHISLVRIYSTTRYLLMLSNSGAVMFHLFYISNSGVILCSNDAGGTASRRLKK